MQAWTDPCEATGDDGPHSSNVQCRDSTVKSCGNSGSNCFRYDCGHDEGSRNIIISSTCGPANWINAGDHRATYTYGRDNCSTNHSRRCTGSSVAYRLFSADAN